MLHNIKRPLFLGSLLIVSIGLNLLLSVFLKHGFELEAQARASSAEHYLARSSAEDELKSVRERLLLASFDRDMNQEALDNATTRGMFFADQGNELMSILRKHEASLVDYLNFVSDNARYINPVQAYEAEKEFSKARDKLKKDIEKWQDAFVEFEQEHALGV